MFPKARMVESNGGELAVYEQGDGEPVLLIHGFPELAFSWRHQMPALAAAGYRAIAPDLCGYGASDKPEGTEKYTIQELMADMTGLLDAMEIERAHIAGHDWGALLAWQLALQVPQRFSSLIALNIPFFPRPPTDPIAIMRAGLGDDFYIVNFQDSDAADRMCAENPTRVFEVMMRRGAVTRERFDQLPREMRHFSLLSALGRSHLAGENLLTPEEAQVYVDAFSAGGFTAPINYYRNWTHNWATTANVEQLVTVPTLFIGANDDVIISPAQIEAMKPFVTDLEIHMLENCGHWSQQEKPDEVNALLLDWLSARKLMQ
jgi:soluble epoxide hydrolase/lipid-phosphate phosphatase